LRWADHVARMEEGRSAFKILSDKPTGKRPLGKPRRRWEENIRMDFKDINIRNWVGGEDGRKILEWTLKTSILGIGLVRFRIAIFGESLVNVALNFRVP